MEPRKSKVFFITIILSLISLLVSLYYFDTVPFFRKSSLSSNNRGTTIELYPIKFNTSSKTNWTQTNQTYFGTSLPEYKALGVDCSRLFKNDVEYIEKVKRQDSIKHKVFPDEKVSEYTSNCKKYRRHYDMTEPSQEEADYPLAFQILTFKEAAQFEFLLKAIYRPHNEYCIHIDKKSKKTFRDAITSVTKCFDNIEVISYNKSVDVQWGYYSVLKPEILCMENLWQRETKWKYLINLTAQEFPLQTMQGLVQILKALRGANSLEGTVARRNLERTERNIDNKPKIPFNREVTIAKGAVHLIVQRGFVDYALHNETAIAFNNWLKDTFHPDETYFPSLNHSPQLRIPGAYTGNPETDPKTYPFIARFKNWGGYPFDYPCAGKRVRGICILSIGDLPLLANRTELFANKFHMDYQPFALQCMRELIYNRTRDERAGNRKIDLSYYKKLKMVKYHVGPAP